MFFKKQPSKQTIELQDAILEKDAFIDSINDKCMTISFEPDGTILDASQMFLDGLGYRLDEVKGKHHRIFCDPEYTRKAEYDNFWRDLNNGRANAGQFMRFKKDGSYVWIEATYIPVTQNGKVVKIFKIAQDITVKYQQLISQEALFKAFDRSNALIEFTPTGNVITANANFLNAMGYKLEDIKGQHHRMFCFDDFYSQNPQFWADLAVIPHLFETLSIA